jgi:hypothetical protein
MLIRFDVRLFLLALCFALGFAALADAADYAGAISAYRRAHGLPVVKLDGKLNAVALKQAQAMAASGTVSHGAAGSFSSRVAPLRKSRGGKYRRRVFDVRRNAEGVGKFHRPSRESAVTGDAPGRRRFRRQSEIALPEILGDGDYGLTLISRGVVPAFAGTTSSISSACPCSATN